MGRADDLAEVARLLGSHRVVTVCGPGGVGKTRLVDELVVASDPGREVVVVELAAVTDPAFVGHSVAAATGLRSTIDPGDVSVLAEHLRDQELMLVLDNCEHLVASVAAFVVAVLQHCPGVTVLTTSQVPLGIAAEVVHVLAPLAVPQDDVVLPEGSSLPAALEMFVDRARSASPSFELTPANRAATHAMVRRLGGLPLAIELAAARMRVLSPEALLDRLDDTFDALGTGFRDAPARHQGLAASMAWTEDLCTDAERELWARLSVFVGGFDLEGAEQVCSDRTLPVEQVLPALVGLVEKSVVTRSDDGRDRYRLLETLREFGAARLRGSGAEERWRDRHRDWFAAVAQDLRRTWVGPAQVAWLQRLDREGANVRAALERALADPAQVPQAIQMCFDLKAYWATQGKSGEGRYWMDRALAPGLGTPRERALLLAMSASFCTRLGDTARARAMVDHARVEAHGLEDDFVEGALCLAEGPVLVRELDLDAAVRRLDDAVRLLRAFPLSYEYTAALVLVGIIFTQLGRDAEGKALLAEAVTEGLRTGEGTSRGYAQVWLALHATPATGAVGDARQADGLLDGALELLWALRDRIGIAMHLEGAAHRAHRRGSEAECALMLGAAAGQWRRMDLEIDQVMVGARVGRFEYRATVPPRQPAEFARGLALSEEEAVSLAFARFRHEPVQAATSATEVDERALPPLSRRESEVARLVAEGASNRDIATRLFISERTVQGHVQSSLRKLDFGSRAQIAAWVVRLTG